MNFPNMLQVPYWLLKVHFSNYISLWNCIDNPSRKENDLTKLMIDEVLPISEFSDFKYIILYEWDVDLNMKRLGKGDIVLTNGKNILVIEVKRIKDYCQQLQQRRLLHVIKQAKYYSSIVKQQRDQKNFPISEFNEFFCKAKVHAAVFTNLDHKITLINNFNFNPDIKKKMEKEFLCLSTNEIIKNNYINIQTIEEFTIPNQLLINQQGINNSNKKRDFEKYTKETKREQKIRSKQEKKERQSAIQHQQWSNSDQYNGQNCNQQKENNPLIQQKQHDTKSLNIVQGSQVILQSIENNKNISVENNKQIQTQNNQKILSESNKQTNTFQITEQKQVKRKINYISDEEDEGEVIFMKEVKPIKQNIPEIILIENPPQSQSILQKLQTQQNQLVFSQPQDMSQQKLNTQETINQQQSQQKQQSQQNTMQNVIFIGDNSFIQIENETQNIQFPNQQIQLISSSSSSKTSSNSSFSAPSFSSSSSSDNNIQNNLYEFQQDNQLETQNTTHQNESQLLDKQFHLTMLEIVSLQEQIQEKLLENENQSRLNENTNEEINNKQIQNLKTQVEVKNRNNQKRKYIFDDSDDSDELSIFDKSINQKQSSIKQINYIDITSDDSNSVSINEYLKQQPIIKKQKKEQNILQQQSQNNEQKLINIRKTDNNYPYLDLSKSKLKIVKKDEMFLNKSIYIIRKQVKLRKAQ